jgi:hypothetical protein
VNNKAAVVPIARVDNAICTPSEHSLQTPGITRRPALKTHV